MVLNAASSDKVATHSFSCLHCSSAHHDFCAEMLVLFCGGHFVYYSCRLLVASCVDIVVQVRVAACCVLLEKKDFEINWTLCLKTTNFT